jgi:hypothetical protein
MFFLPPPAIANAIHILLRISATNMALRTAIFLPSRMKKRKYNATCVEDEVSISDNLSEELDMVSGNEMNMENEEQNASEESSNTSPESECESETSVACIDGWEDVTFGDKTLNAYTFTKNVGPQFHLLPDAEPINYFS